MTLSIVASELVVNVKNKGGDVQVESIDADTAANTISMYFVKIDGTHIYQFIDFKSVSDPDFFLHHCPAKPLAHPISPFSLSLIQ